MFFIIGVAYLLFDQMYVWASAVFTLHKSWVISKFIVLYYFCTMTCRQSRIYVLFLRFKKQLFYKYYIWKACPQWEFKNEKVNSVNFPVLILFIYIYMCILLILLVFFSSVYYVICQGWLWLFLFFLNMVSLSALAGRWVQLHSTRNGSS